MICGIDNGVTGSIGFVEGTFGWMFKTPTFSERYYTKKERNATRVDFSKLVSLFMQFKPEFAYIERPMLNGARFQSSISAARSMEATMIALEQCGIKYAFIDSKEWQKLLGEGDTKVECMKFAQKTYPEVNYKGFKDADGLIIAHYAQTIQIH